MHVTRAIGTAVLALAFGLCHSRLPLSQKGIKRRGAVMMQVCINSSMMATIKTLNSFPKEREVVRKELSKTKSDGTKLYGKQRSLNQSLIVFLPSFFVVFALLTGRASRVRNWAVFSRKVAR